MNVTVKTPDEQEKMRTAGRLAASVLDMIEPYVQPGVTTEELDKRCYDFIVDELKSDPCEPQLSGLPEDHLHLRQSRGLPWHPGR